MNESEPSEHNRLSLCSDYTRGILKVPSGLLDSGICDHSLGAGAGGLRFAEQAAEIQADVALCRIAQRAQHILAQGKLKLDSMHRHSEFELREQIRSTGAIDV